MTRASDVDAAWVRQQRERGFGWAHVARMAGCAEADLRARYDPQYSGVARARVAPEDRVRLWLQQGGMVGVDATIVARMWAANGVFVSAVQLCDGLWSAMAQPSDSAKAARMSAERRNLATFVIAESAKARAGVRGAGTGKVGAVRGPAMSPRSIQAISRAVGVAPDGRAVRGGATEQTTSHRTGAAA